VTAYGFDLGLAIWGRRSTVGSILLPIFVLSRAGTRQSSNRSPFGLLTLAIFDLLFGEGLLSRVTGLEKRSERQ
jgi:hypothetical protein